MAQSAITIDSPRDGASISTSTWGRPRGRAQSPSASRGVQVLLQRAGRAGWESWSGDTWSVALTPHAASFNPLSGTWAWPEDVALPASTLMGPGSYRLLTILLASNGSVLARSGSAFVVEGRIVRRDAPSNDLSANATVITGALGSIAGTTVDASPGGPAGEGMSFPDVWYRWTAPPGTSRASFGVDNGGFLYAYLVETDGTFPQIGYDGAASRMTFEVAPGREYLILVGARFGNSSPFTLRWAAGLASPNDTPSTATEISGMSGQATGQNVGALGHDNSIAPREDGSHPDVWWKWRSPSGASSVTFDARGSSFPAVLRVYELVLSNGEQYLNVKADGTGAVTFEAKPSSLYYVEVSGEGGAQGDIMLAWSALVRPANDLIANATRISGLSGSVTGTTVGALAHDWDGNAESGRAPDVFYRWTAPSGGSSVATFNVRGSGFAATLYVNDGASTIVSGASPATFSAQPGRSYLISVEGTSESAAGAFTLTWSTASRPANDTAPTASLISGAAGQARGSNANALGHDLGTSEDSSEPDVFWKWTAPRGGDPVAVFNTNGSSFDTVLAVYRLNRNSVANMGEDDDSGEGNKSLVRFSATPGSQYLIAVWGKSRATGSIVLNWSTAQRPANDLPRAAIAISGASGQATGFNTDALGHGPNGLAESGENDVWWKWRAPSGLASPARFDIDGSRFNSAIAVWKSEGAGGFTLVGRDNSGSQRFVTFTTVPGAEYFIEVLGNGGRAGSIVLNWRVTSTGTVRGRFVGGAGALVYLVPGTTTLPLRLPDTREGIRSVRAESDGTYQFRDVAPGSYVVVPRKTGVVASPASRPVTSAPGSTATADFSLGRADSVGPNVSVGGAVRATLNGAHVATSISGTVSDGAASGESASGLDFVGYVVYRLSSDATSLRQPPGLRRPAAVYSQRARAFVETSEANGTVLATSDTLIFTGVPLNGGWSASFSEDLKAALASPGTYRVAVLAQDNAGNAIRNPATSNDPDRIANGNAVFAHFEISQPNIAVTRTLPLSVANGSTITYAISISNTGDLPLENVAARQTINTDKTVLNGASISPRQSAIEGADVVWSLGTIPAHSTRLLKLNVRAADNNPFGSNIAAGGLSVTSSDRNYFFGRDQINIESSVWVIGGALNALRAIGDAVGGAFNFVFGSSARDQRAQADLGTIRNTSAVTRLAGADALRFGNGATLIPIGGGKIVAAGAGNIVAAGGGNIVAAGAGNIVAAGAGNAVTIGGQSASNILSQLVSNPSSVLSHNGGVLRGANLFIAGGNNIVAAGAGNVISTGGNGIVAAGGGNFIDNATGLLSANRVRLIGADGASLIGADGATLRGLNGAGLVGNNGNTLKLAGGQGNALIGADGASLIGADGASLIGADGAT